MSNMKCAALSVVGISLVALAAPAAAQQRQTFDIPAGSLQSALATFGKQSGRPLIYKSDDVQGRISAGYRGDGSAEQALDAILSGSGLVPSFDRSGAIAIRRNVGATAIPRQKIAQAAPAPAANAQNAAPIPAQQEEAIGEITVTARRRVESLQSVPVSVSVQSGEDLVQKGVSSVMDLGRIAPALSSAPSARGNNTPNLALRGQRAVDTSIVLDPVVLSYVNEVPFMRAQGLNAALFDIASVQVLRGPQGTLFGRNTTGGAVLITTNAPTDRLEGSLSATVGNYDRITGEAMLNIPLAEGASLRVAGIRTKRDGYMRNRINGSRANDENFGAYRVSLKLEPAEGITSTTFLNGFRSNEAGSAIQAFAYTPRSGTAAVAAQIMADIAENRADPFSFVTDYTTAETARTWDLTNITTIELADGLTLKNVAGYRKINTFSQYDLDGTRLFLQRFQGEAHIKQFTEELQLQGEGARFDWMVGLFYSRESGSDVATSFQPATPTLARQSGVIATNRSYSAFLSGTYRFAWLQGLSASAGVRYTRDERRSSGLQTVGSACSFRLNDGSLLAPPCLYPQAVNFEEPSWSVALNYQATSDLLVYLAHRHGYRSGGLQARATSEAAATIVKPEKVNDIEAGVKSDFRIGPVPVRFNLAAYKAWYEDVQRLVNFVSPSNGTLVSGLLNAARSTVQGLEAELTARPARGLELSGGVGYVDPKYSRFDNNGVDISDAPFGYVPTFTANAQASYTSRLPRQLGSMTGFINYSYQNRIYNTDVPQANSRLPGFGLWNARLDWDDVGGSTLSLSAFMNNIGNKAYFPYGNNFSSSSTLGMSVRWVGLPRMYGLSARYRF